MYRFWLRRTWRSLSQLRLGVTALVLLSIAAALGTLLPQVPRDTNTSNWWAAVSDRYGLLYGPLRALSLFDVYHSIWFQVLAGLLLLSALACFANRVLPLTRVALRPRTRLPAERFDRAALRARFFFPSARRAESTLRTALRRRRYRVQAEWHSASTSPSQRLLFLRADRHRLPRLGTLLTHGGLILLLLGAAWSDLRRWHMPALSVNSSVSTPVGHGTGIGLRCERFAVLRYDDDVPRNYRADLALSDENGSIMTRSAVTIGHPLTFRGVSYHLQGFRLPMLSGTSLDEGKFCDITLSAVRDPGYGPVVAAGFLLLIGVTLTFHFPHRRLWARIAPAGDTILIGSTAWDKERFRRQFDALAAELASTTGQE